VTLVNRMVDARPCNVIDVLRRVRNCRTIIIIIIIKDKRSIAVSNMSHRYGNSRATWDHTVLPAKGDIPAIMSNI